MASGCWEVSRRVGVGGCWLVSGDDADGDDDGGGWLVFSVVVDAGFAGAGRYVADCVTVENIL